MKDKLLKRLLSTALAVAVITVTTVFAVPSASEILKYQAKNTVCAFVTEEFADSYGGSVPLESIVITDLPAVEAGVLELSGGVVAENQSIALNDISNMTFTPVENYLGEAVFAYKAYNGAEYSQTAKVKIRYVENISDSIPTAVSFEIEVEKDTAKTAQLKYEYTGNEALSYTVFEAPKKGSVEIISADGDFVYTPYAGSTGNDSFSFRVSTNSIDSNIATCSITISSSEHSTQPFNFVYQDTINHWVNYSAVKMVEKDIYKGERIGSEYYFRPETLLTRIDIINYILAALDVDTDDVDMNETHIFKDSPELPDYINKAAYKAYELGIIEGQKINGALYLNPYTNINRAEMVKMLDKAMGPKTRSDSSFEYIDGASVPDWAVQHFKNMIAYGIIKGYDDNSLRPYATVTKAQATEMIYQMVKYNEANTPTLAQRVVSGLYFKESVL